MILTIIIFLIVLSLLVFVHELGHFVVAKRSGMKVHEFGFGFPPRVIGVQKVDGKWRIIRGNKNVDPDKTVYSINAIPLGGFVKIMGEDNDNTNDPQSFTNKSFWQRLGALAAGVIMNVIFAAVLLSIGYMAGLPSAVQSLEDIPAKATFKYERLAIIGVLPDSPAEKAGFKMGDLIDNVNGQTFQNVAELQTYIRQNSGKDLQFEIKRLSETAQVKVQPVSQAQQGGGGFVGIGLAPYGKLKYSPPQAIVEGVKTTGYQLAGIVTGLYHLFFQGEGLKDVGGPVLIAKYTGQVASVGFIALLQFSAFLSLNLAVLNTLPFPALDGGRMLFLIIEKIRGKKNNQAIEQYANAIGFMLLLILMLVITVRDVSQLESVKNLFS